MNIQKMLLEPSMMKLKEGYDELRRAIGLETSEQAASLSLYASRKIHQVEVILSELAAQPKNEFTEPSAAQTQAYRKLKLDLRFAQRRWQRMLSTENRLRKMHEKRPHVSTFAA
jgi:hypothetical protein